METRIIVGQVRAVAGKAMRVSGLAARYNSPAKIGKRFVEKLAPGAFRSAVQSKQDTKFLINHDVNRLMGSVAAGTLRLRETNDGLEFDADLPDTEDARNAYAAIERGDMHQCSFGFDCDKEDEQWEMGDDPDDRAKRMAHRTIKNIRVLSDVSAVTFPAYSATHVQARSAEEIENRSDVVVPAEFIVKEPETDSVEAIARRRQLLGISLL
jgi:HK97 family phage prohead protease